MATKVIELPESVVAKVEKQNISDDALYSFIVDTVERWLHRRESTSASSPFAESAVDYIDQLIADNREFYEELARL